MNEEKRKKAEAMTKIDEILETNESLYDFLKEQYQTFGWVPERLLTPEVLERLFIYENIPDSLTGELFGLNSRQVARRRYKHNIKWNAPKYRMEQMTEWFEEKKKELRETLTEGEIATMWEQMKVVAGLQDHFKPM